MSPGRTARIGKGVKAAPDRDGEPSGYHQGTYYTTRNHVEDAGGTAAQEIAGSSHPAALTDN